MTRWKAQKRWMRSRLNNQSLMENLHKILIPMLTLKSIEYMPNTSDELAVISSTHNNHSMELENDFDSVGLAVDVE